MPSAGCNSGNIRDRHELKALGRLGSGGSLRSSARPSLRSGLTCGPYVARLPRAGLALSIRQGVGIFTGRYFEWWKIRFGWEFERGRALDDGCRRKDRRERRTE